MTTVTGDRNPGKTMSKTRNGVGRDLSTLLAPSITTRPRVPQTLRVNVTRKLISYQQPLQVLEDRRRWRPEPLNARPLVSVSVGASARLVAKQNPRFNQLSHTKAITAFAEPHKLPLCIRRHQRREVLFAKGVGGSKNLRKPTRNQWSDISCK